MMKHGLPLLSRALFHSQQKPSTQLQSYNCQFCRLKQKFNGTAQKCIAHSIIDSNSPASNANNSIIDNILDLLDEISQMIDEYWNNLHDYSKGNPVKVKQQIKPVIESIQNIQEKLFNFPIDDSWGFPKLQKQKSKESPQRKWITRSQKYITSTNFTFEDELEMNEKIKQWVMHFYKIMINKQVRGSPFRSDEDMDLKIFKQSMERRYFVLANNYDKYERRCSEALERLLFYMQKFGSHLNEDVLKKDIQFLEENQSGINHNSSQSGIHQLLVMQALSIQKFLAERQIVERLDFDARTL